MNYEAMSKNELIEAIKEAKLKPKNSHKLIVTIPYNDFNDYVEDRKDYNNLKKQLKACFEVPTDKTQPIIVKTKKLRDVARQFIGFNIDNSTFIDD